MYLTISKPNQVVPDKRDYPKTRLWVNLSNKMKFNFIKWLLIISGLLTSSYVIAALEVTPTAHDFSRVPAGHSSTEQVFTVSNNGTAALSLDTVESFITVTDAFGNTTTAPSTEFIINTDLCSNTQMAASGTCQVAMIFGPKSVGAKTATLSISPQDLNTTSRVNVSLSGQGANDPNIEASLESYDFGEIDVSRTSRVQAIQIFNTGKDYLEIGEVSLAGDTADFSLTNFCSNLRIRVNRYCSLRVIFKPQSEGLKKATVSIPSNDPDTPNLEMIFSGGSDVIKVPHIEVEPLENDFGEIQVGSVSLYKMMTIYNKGTDHLQLGVINLSGEDFTSMDDLCSNTKLKPLGRCIINLRFEPKSIGAKTGMLSILSDDPETPTTEISLMGTGSSSCAQYQFLNSSSSSNLGIEVVGKSGSLKQNFNIQAKGCISAVKIETIEVISTPKDEFSINDKQCYHGNHGNTYHSNCQFTIVFSPQSEGVKQAKLHFKLTDGQVKEVSLQAEAVSPPGQPEINVNPISHDFGSIIIGRSASSPRFDITNNGSSNLTFSGISLIGTDKSAFKKNYDSCSSRGFLQPLEQCYIDLEFMPITAGNLQANLSITSDDPDSPIMDIPLTGIAQAPGDCSEANITIESSGHPSDHHWAAKTQETSSLSRSGVHYFHTYSGEYEGETLAWKRVKNFNEGESATPNKPRENDVVKIKNGHTITGIPYAKVRALCIEEGGRLESLDDQGTSLEIYARDYIENKGTIKGQHGVEGKAGAGIYLISGGWTYNSSPFYNEGKITAGHGGDAMQYGGKGGAVNIHGDGITNTLRHDGSGGVVLAGNGGDITGIQTGQGGNGGRMTVLGRSYIHHYGDVKITAGDGGYCNPAAVASQTGGKGGDVGWNARTSVRVEGIFTAGKGGRNCSINGRDGHIYMDPSLISLIDGHTKIEGNNVTIFGGNEWTLNLSDLNGTDSPILSATGDITLAVGQNGIIDFRGSKGHILKANGHVYLFADLILLDDGVKLSDLINSFEGIVVGPNKVLHEMSLSGANQLFGKPQEMLTVNFTLSNDGPETDTYFLNVTDTAGWLMNQLPSSFQIEGVDAVDLALDVTLPNSLGATNTITITAISQSDPSVSISKERQIFVNATGSNNVIAATSPIQPLSNCTHVNTIDWLCRNDSHQVLTDVTIESQGNVSGGQFAGHITNRGIISQAQIQEGAVIEGGKVTGYIDNKGTLSNIEFVGAVVSGGTLAETIRNNSKIKGTFKDVHLAPNAHIIGGYLQGRIMGDKNAPALLENVTIKSGSLLTGVQLGEGVVLGEEVTCGEAVQAEEGVCPGDRTLPLLGTMAVNAQGQPFTVEAILSGGLSVNNNSYERQVTQTISDLTDIIGHIQTESTHLGEDAEMVVYVRYQPLSAAPSDSAVYFMLDEQGDIYPWDEDMTTLIPFRSAVTLTSVLEVPIYQGPLPATGILNIHFGYRLADKGTVVYNRDAIEVIVNETP